MHRSFALAFQYLLMLRDYFLSLDVVLYLAEAPSHHGLYLSPLLILVKLIELPI